MSATAYTAIAMVEPASFGYNVETAATNRFQHASNDSAAASMQTAQLETVNLAVQLRAAGVAVCVAQDSAQPVKPDAVFPNNWVSFHADGTVVLYPLYSANRRLERREAVVASVKQQLGFRELRRIDLSQEEKHGRYLEGTGSLVLDRAARVAYACRSPRTDESLVREWARLMDYEAMIFDAATPDGTPVYHTNVLLWIGKHIAGIGLDWVAPADRDKLCALLQRSNDTHTPRELLWLSSSALYAFAGNMLEIETQHGSRLAMSAAAARSLDEHQHALLRQAGCEPVIAAIPTVERLGGGSVRCMLAEVPR